MQRIDLPPELWKEIISTACDGDYSTWTKLRLTTTSLAKQAEQAFPIRVGHMNHMQALQNKSILSGLPGYFRTSLWTDVKWMMNDQPSKFTWCTFGMTSICITVALSNFRFDIVVAALLGIPPIGFVTECTYQQCRAVMFFDNSAIQNCKDDFKRLVSVKRI